MPGDVGKSELVARIFSDDADEQMPPPKSNRRLTAQQKETLKRWIAEGAKYEKHWAYMAPVRGIPAVKDTKWPRNPIDYFVLAKLEENGLEPSPEADRATLIRRLSLDLSACRQRRPKSMPSKPTPRPMRMKRSSIG